MVIFVFEKIKLLLGIDDASKDDVINFCISLVTDEVLNYCNIEVLPARLENIVVAMCVDCFNFAMYGEGDSARGEAKAIKEGDTSIDFVTCADIMSVSNDGGYMKKYSAQLDRFRKLVWL